MLKERHREKEEYISRLAKDKEEMKVGPPPPLWAPLRAGPGPGVAAECLSLQVKLLELQELVVRLVGERNEWYGRFLGASQNPAAEPTTAPPAPQATGAAHSQGGE